MKQIPKHIVITSLLALGLTPSAALAAKGGNGGGKDKPGESEPGQIISVELEFDELHTGPGDLDPLSLDWGKELSDPDVDVDPVTLMGSRDPNGFVSDAGTYVDGDDGLIDVGENFNIVLDPDLPRTFSFPLGMTVLPGKGCGLLLAGCEPNLGEVKVKGQWGPLLECGDQSVPQLYGDDTVADVELIISGRNHDDSPVGTVRYVNARLRLVDAIGDGWGVYFGGRESPGGSVESPCGSYIVVTRMPNVAGKAVWQFHTEANVNGEHVGYLYFDNRSPHHESEFHGMINLSFSGTLTSLSDVPEPTVDITFGDETP